MRILMVHNRYQQPGGEDVVFRAETALLRQHGHEVVEYIEDNSRINRMHLPVVAVQTIWSRPSHRKLLRVLRDVCPDVVHFHNTFLLISPSVYYACREVGVPVIQSLHNPRLLCPKATFCRDGRICEDCLGRVPPWPAILHACYHDSRVRTTVVATMLAVHHWLKTWQRQIDIYIVFTDFYRRKFIEGGLPAEKIVIKPHFIDPDPGLRRSNLGNYALFIGRLDPAKGVRVLLKAWQQITGIPLKIRGDGRLLGEVQGFIERNHSKSVEIVNHLSKEHLVKLIKGAKFLVWPSEGFYETFGLVAVEAFACGTPVIASRIGVMVEIVDDGQTGLHFAPGDPEDLAAKVEWAWSHPKEMGEMGQNSRREYEKKYTAERNYGMLMEIYQRAIAQARTRGKS